MAIFGLGLKCPNCGSRIKKDDINCRNCGKYLPVLVNETDHQKIARTFLDKAQKLYKKRRNQHRALTNCEKALEYMPESAEAHNLRGLILDDLGLLDDAILEFTKAVELDPDYKDALQNLKNAEALYEVINKQHQIIKSGRHPLPGVKPSQRYKRINKALGLLIFVPVILTIILEINHNSTEWTTLPLLLLFMGVIYLAFFLATDRTIARRIGAMSVLARQIGLRFRVGKFPLLDKHSTSLIYGLYKNHFFLMEYIFERMEMSISVKTEISIVTDNPNNYYLDIQGKRRLSLKPKSVVGEGEIVRLSSFLNMTGFPPNFVDHARRVVLFKDYLPYSYNQTVRPRANFPSDWRKWFHPSIHLHGNVLVCKQNYVVKNAERQIELLNLLSDLVDLVEISADSSIPGSIA